MTSRYLYNCNAVAFGGQIVSPFTEVVESQAAAVLPVTGGYGSARVNNYKYRELVSFGYAQSVVTGSATQNGGQPTYNSLCTVMIEDVNIAGVITADRIVARLVAEDSPAREKTADPEPHICPIGSHFDNLRVAGFPVNLECQKPFQECNTYTKLVESCNRHEVAFVDNDGKPAVLQGEFASRTKPIRTRANSYFQDTLLRTSLFSEPTKEKKDIEDKTYAQGKVDSGGVCSIHVPGFGTVYFGDYIVSMYSRRLTMMRVELGCPEVGTLTFGGLIGNGHTFP